MPEGGGGTKPPFLAAFPSLSPFLSLGRGEIEDSMPPSPSPPSLCFPSPFGCRTDATP